MSANALLLWMSAREAGSWHQFRGAIERLHVEQDNGSDAAATQEGWQDFPLHQQLRFNLERLGHAEFAISGQSIRWRIAPPVLAISKQRDGWLGVAAGARSQQLLRRLGSSPLAQSAEMHAACPDVLLLRGEDPRALATHAANAGMLIQQDAPAAILACSDPIDAKRLRVPIDVPRGSDWIIQRFCTNGLKWVPAARSEIADATGHLFSFEFQHIRHVLFCSDGTACSTTPAIGKYLALKRARRSVLRYDPQAGRLSVPSSCRPPILIERALALCSGRPPLYEVASSRGIVYYDSVGPAIALTVASQLRQEIRH